MVSFDEAHKIVKEKLCELNPQAELISLRNSIGRITAEDIFSELELPGFDNSAMDGIVVKFYENIRSWKMIGEISAGNFKEIKLLKGDAAAIMTGARMPDSGNTVIPIEDIEYEGKEVYLRKDVLIKPFQNVRKKGQDLIKNEKLIAKHTRITAKHILLLASAGVAEVRTLMPLKAGVIATGDELIDIDSEVINDNVYASNLYTIEALANDAGMDCVYSSISKDIKSEIKEKITAALNKGIEILITSGGVSMSKYDHVQDVLNELGANIIFWKVYIKPGKPMLFAEIMWNGKKVLIFGLPGNPVSAFVNFIIFIRGPISEILHGFKPMVYSALLKEDIHKKDEKRHFVRGIIEYNNTSGRNEVIPMVNQSSSNMFGLSISNTLIVVKENMTNPVKGESVECIMI